MHVLVFYPLLKQILVEWHVSEDTVVTCYSLGSFLERMIFFLVAMRVYTSEYMCD